jgi:hypothetical protein
VNNKVGRVGARRAAASPKETRPAMHSGPVTWMLWVEPGSMMEIPVWIFIVGFCD